MATLHMHNHGVDSNIHLAYSLSMQHGMSKKRPISQLVPWTVVA